MSERTAINHAPTPAAPLPPHYNDASAGGAQTRAQAQQAVMLLSFRHRDSMADVLTKLGCQVVAARRVDGVVRRFLGLSNPMVVLDARDAVVEGLQAAERLGPLVRANAGSLLLIYDRRDAGFLPAFVETGITAMVAGPWREEELAAAVALAQMRSATPQAERSNGGQCWWHTDVEDGQIHIDASSDEDLHSIMAQSANLFDVVNQFSAQDRGRAFGAIRKLRRVGGYAAFVQRDALTLDGELIHHLTLDGNRLSGQVERVNSSSTILPNLGGDPLTGLIDLGRGHPCG